MKKSRCEMKLPLFLFLFRPLTAACKRRMWNTAASSEVLGRGGWVSGGGEVVVPMSRSAAAANISLHMGFMARRFPTECWARDSINGSGA